MELLEFEEEEENNAPIDFHDDGFYDNTDQFCEDDDALVYDFCSRCDENPIAYLGQACDFLICTNCVKNCTLRVPTVNLDDFE